MSWFEGKLKKTVCGLLCFVLAVGLFAQYMPAEAEETASVRIGIVDYSYGIRVRTDAGTENSIVATISNGTMLYIIGEKYASDGVLWYQVTEFSDSPTYSGYSTSEYINIVESPDSSAGEGGSGETDDFEAYLTAQGFPESYKPALRVLHQLYPDWEFVAVHTNLDWATVVAKESVVGKNLVPRTSSTYYINTSDVDANGNQRSRDGYAWVAASTEITAYYLDPRNFLSVPYIFMFESLSYSETAHTESGVERILAGTFMDSDNTVVISGTTYTYAQIFMKAAADTGVSPYHLASRVKQEQGVTGTTLSYGNVSGYEGYYNFFNINAVTSSSASASVNGAIYAKSQGWTNQLISIVKGSEFVGSAYINKGQDTLYFQKFNVVNKASGLYSHQYMTNVMAAASESAILRNAYSDLNMSISFRIPVYLNMPSAAAVKPSASTMPTASGSGMSFSGSFVTGVTQGISAGSLLGKISVTNNGTARITNASGSVKTSGTIVTGDKIQVLTNAPSVYKTYTIVIYGDVNADGVIDMLDLLTAKKHTLGLMTLTGAQLKAADTDKNGSVNIVDLLIIKRHLLELQTISQ